MLERWTDTSSFVYIGPFHLNGLQQLSPMPCHITMGVGVGDGVGVGLSAFRAITSDMDSNKGRERNVNILISAVN